jgi:Ser/Thr protein kinase RdoA (MazF antagonist)
VDEEPLAGGNLSDGVVRVGDTVRRPTGPWTPVVHALLTHLAAKGFRGAPRVLGIDEQGREILEFVAGDVAWPDPSALDVARVGRMLRAFHDAVADFAPPADAVWRFPEMAADAVPFADARGIVVCHNDCAAWNLVVSTERVALIDWDTAGPRPPIWDVAYFVASIMRLPDAGVRLRAFADGYDLSESDRARLPDVVVARVTSSYEHMRRRALANEAPWDQMWADGHGDAWAAMRTFASEHTEEWRRALTA